MKIFIYIAVVTGILSCKNKIKVVNLTPYVIDVQHEVPKDEIHQTVRQFQSKVRSHQKTNSSSETPVEEAIWSQEALANFEFAQNYFNGVDLVADTLMYSLYCYQDSTGNYVTNTQDVVSSYLQLADSLALLDSSMRYQYINIYGTVNPGQNNISITALAFKTPPLVITADIITAWDNYQAGFNYGHCNKIDQGDVKWRIMKHLNWNMSNGFSQNSFGSAYPQGNYYFTSVKHIFGDNMGNTPNDLNKLMGMPMDPYANTSPAYGSCYRANYCISHDKIQYYANRTWAILSYHNQPGWEPIGVKIIDVKTCSKNPWSPKGLYNKFQRGDYGIVVIATP